MNEPTSTSQVSPYTLQSICEFRVLQFFSFLKCFVFLMHVVDPQLLYVCVFQMLESMRWIRQHVLHLLSCHVFKVTTIAQYPIFLNEDLLHEFSILAFFVNLHFISFILVYINKSNKCCKNIVDYNIYFILMRVFCFSRAIFTTSEFSPSRN